MVSVSATLVKTLAGAQAYKAKRKISVEDDKHLTDITRGETFYLKHDAKKKAYLLFDVDQDDNTIYKFVIDKKTYTMLVGSHTELGAVTKSKEPTVSDIAKALSEKSGVKVTAKAYTTWVEDGSSKSVDKAINSILNATQIKSLNRAAKLEQGVLYAIGLGPKTSGGINLANLIDTLDTSAKPKPKPSGKAKPQDYKDQVPLDRRDRGTMIQTIFQGAVKTTPTSMTVDVDMDSAQVRREAKKAGFRAMNKGSVVNFIHADGTQMDVAVKDGYIAIRFK